MAGTIGDINDFSDIVRLLETHPEWRADLRRLILTEEIVNVPGQIARLTDHVVALASAQARTDVQMTTLTTRVEDLTIRMTALTAQMTELTRVMRGMTDDLGKLKGLGMEGRVRTHGGAFFGGLVRHPHVLSSEELNDVLEEAIDQGKLSSTETAEIQWTDAVVQGTRRADGVAVYLVVEVSWAVDTNDVERAAHRAALLAKAGTVTQAVVVGETVRPAATQLAPALQVWQVTDKEAVPPAA